MPPFRGEKDSDPRGAILRFKTIDDARVALRMLDGRVGPGGEALHMELSRPPAVHPNQMWRWVYEVEDMEKRGVVVREKRASRMRGEGLGLGRVRKNKILRMLNIERVEAARTCSSWSEAGCRDGG